MCSDLRADKEPRAVLFYKEEGNKRFGRKQYTAAAVLYSKVQVPTIWENGIPAFVNVKSFYARPHDVELHCVLYQPSLVQCVWKD